jgi:hypothetical protein
VNASGLVTLGAAVNHLTGWGAINWCKYILGAVGGWIAVGVPVPYMHHIEMKRMRQQPPPPPTEPATWAERQDYLLAGVIGLSGAVVGGMYGWIVARHVAGLYSLLVWWALPFICDAAALLYWFRWAKIVEYEGTPIEGRRSKAGVAAGLATLIYCTGGVLILGADGITRMAAAVAMSSDATIVVLLLALLGWVLWWLSRPRRSARRK